uniref:Putative ovule protein n=1 Tax=Solanum chacoense TaxID=4108 RepID=A0A0V0IHJ8_SOLCH
MIRNIYNHFFKQYPPQAFYVLGFMSTKRPYLQFFINCTISFYIIECSLFGLVIKPETRVAILKLPPDVMLYLFLNSTHLSPHM